MRSFFLTLFLLVCFNVSAQIDDYQKDIICLLELNGTQEEYAAEYENVMYILKRNFETANITAKDWKKIKEDRPESMAELTRVLSYAYRKHFSHEEITQLIDFYETDAAQKWIKRKRGKLNETETESVQAFLDSDIGVKESSKLDVLKTDAKDISSFWKRELIGTKISALVKLGYRTKF